MSEKEDRRYHHGRSGQHRTGDYCKKHLQTSPYMTCVTR